MFVSVDGLSSAGTLSFVCPGSKSELICNSLSDLITSVCEFFLTSAWLCSYAVVFRFGLPGY